MNILHISLRSTVLVAVMTMPMGCTTYGERMMMGGSVEEMSTRQTAYARPLVEPDIPTLDGPKGEQVLSTYRADVGEPKQVQNAIQVNIGN